MPNTATNNKHTHTDRDTHTDTSIGGMRVAATNSPAGHVKALNEESAPMKRVKIRVTIITNM